MNVLSYARLSVDDPDRDGPSSSIQDQHADNRAWMAQRGIECAGELTDDGYSGTLRWEKRPGLREAFRRISAGEASILVCKNQDRFARGTWNVGYCRIGLEDAGGTLMLREEERLSDLEVGVRAVMGGEYVEQTRRRVTEKMRGKAARGEYTGGKALFGYRWISRSGRAIVPEEAAVLRMIFDGFDPAGGNKTKAQLSAETGFDRQRIHRILVHPAYAGAYTYGRHAAVRGKRHQLKRTDPSRWIVEWGAHDPIVSREQWERCQERLRRQSQSWAAADPSQRATLPLTGLLRCGDCGADLRVIAMYRHRSTGRPSYYYGCTTAFPRHADRTPPRPCANGARAKVDGWVESLLARLASAFVEAALAHDIHAAMRRAYEAGREIGHLEAEVARLERAERSITAAISSGQLLDTTGLAAELARTQRGLHGAREALRRDRLETGALMSTEAIHGLLRGAAADLEEISGHPRVAEVARPLLHRFVESIDVWPREGRAEIQLRSSVFTRLSAASLGWAIEPAVERALPPLPWAIVA